MENNAIPAYGYLQLLKHSQTFHLVFIYNHSQLIQILLYFFLIIRKFSYGIKNSADKVAEGLLENVFDQSMALLFLAEASII